MGKRGFISILKWVQCIDCIYPPYGDSAWLIGRCLRQAAIRIFQEPLPHPIPVSRHASFASHVGSKACCVRYSHFTVLSMSSLGSIVTLLRFTGAHYFALLGS